MIYTVGYTKTYLKLFALDSETPEDRAPFKLGRRPPGDEDYPNGYPGGSVFQSQEQAQAWLDEKNLLTYSIFGVEADWDTDTAPRSDASFRDLLVDAKLVLLK